MACELCEGAKCKGECDDPTRNWTIGRAAELCRALEEFAPEFGAHVALTGGCLYKKGSRKDCDIVVYRHGGRELPLDRVGFTFACADRLGMVVDKMEGRVYKLRHGGRQVDFLFHDTAEAAAANPNADGSSG